MTKQASISRNLTLGLILTIMIFGLSGIAVYYFVQMEKGKKQLDLVGNEYAEAIGNALKFSLWNLNSESIKLTSHAYANNDLIVYLLVKDTFGNVLFHHENSERSPTGKIHTFKVNYENDHVGTIELVLTDDFIKQHNRQVILFGILMIFLSCICLALMTRFLLTRFLERPLHNLKFLAHEYSKGNYSTDIVPTSYLEFGELRSTLITMGKTIELQMAELQRAEQSIKRHRDHLEKEVLERTQELNNNKQKLEAILKASPVGIGLTNDRRLEWANETMYQLVGYEQGSLLGKNADILYASPQEYERVGKELYDNIFQKEGSVETQWVRQDGTIFDCSMRAFFLDLTDPSKGWIIAVNDISREKELEAKLRRAEKMEVVGTLAGGVAHDLNNILSGIVSYPELLLLDLPSNSPLQKPLQTIQKSGEKAVNIVQDLLTMARRGVSTTEVVNINHLISDQLTSPEMEKLKTFHPDVKITTRLAEDLLNVKGSPTHLSKSIMNILSNAAEAMPDGGTISICSTNQYLDTSIKGYEQIAEGDYVKIEISDTGTGLSKNEIGKIFEPFYTKKSMNRSGTGLGMAVVWGTVKDHNGYIDIDSSRNKGTTITLFIPVCREQVKEKTAGIPIDTYRGNSELILLVDDVEEQREIAGEMLKRLGYKVLAVSSGEEAISYLRKNPADIILLDMIMDPGLDGLDTYKKILEINPAQKTVIASGFSKTERVTELQKLGAGKYIKKPYTLEKIGSAIKDELHRR